MPKKHEETLIVRQRAQIEETDDTLVDPELVLGLRVELMTDDGDDTLLETDPLIDTADTVLLSDLPGFAK